MLEIPSSFDYLLLYSETPNSESNQCNGDYVFKFFEQRLRRRVTTPQEGAKETLDMAGEEAGRGSRIERSETGSDGSRNAATGWRCEARRTYPADEAPRARRRRSAREERHGER